MSVSFVKFGVMCGLLVAAIGCSSTGQERASQAASSLQSTRTEIANTQGALDTAVLALTDLVEKPQGDMKAQYATYQTAVGELDKQSKAVAASAKAMRERGDEYFKAWEAELADISNPELRQVSAERQAKLSAHYKKVTEGFEKAKAGFDPLLIKLTDVKTVLGLDLTETGVKMATPPAKDARKSAVNVKKELTGVSTELDELAKVLSNASTAEKK